MSGVGTLTFILLLTAMFIVAALFFRRRGMVMRIPARVENIRTLMNLATEKAREAQLSESAIYHCRLAVDEAMANIIEHAYPEGEGEVEVHVKVRDGEWQMHLIDFGEPYDPKVIRNKSLAGKSLDEAKPGGLGLYLMRSVMDEVQYTATPRGNRLVMVKRR